MELFRQEYWNGLPFSSPGDLPDPRIEPGSPSCRQILYWLSHVKGSILLPVEHLLIFRVYSVFLFLVSSLTFGEAMAPHSSTLAWKIPWTEEPGSLQFMGSLRVRRNWAISLSCIAEGNGNPLVFLPGESQGWGSLVGCRLWGHTESDTTEAT